MIVSSQKKVHPHYFESGDAAALFATLLWCSHCFVFRPLAFSFSTFSYITALFQNGFQKKFSSICTQYPIITKQKLDFRNFFKFIKKINRNTLFT
jgi:hypothetical protein